MLSFTESLMTYALGRRVEHYDMPTIRTIVARRGEERLTGSRRSCSGVVKSPAFQHGGGRSARPEDAQRNATRPSG